MYHLLIKQSIWRRHVKVSKRTTLYDSYWTNKLNYKYIWFDINQVNISGENQSTDLIIFLLGNLVERILIKLNLYLILKQKLQYNGATKQSLTLKQD